MIHKNQFYYFSNKTTFPNNIPKYGKGYNTNTADFSLWLKG